MLTEDTINGRKNFLQGVSDNIRFALFCLSGLVEYSFAYPLLFQNIQLYDLFVKIFFQLNKKAGAVLRILLKEKTEYVFSARRIRNFHKIVEKAQIEDFTFHDLRHTFASWLMQKGRNLKEIQILLGHSTINMTMRYAHLAPEDTRRAVDNL